MLAMLHSLCEESGMHSRLLIRSSVELDRVPSPSPSPHALTGFWISLWPRGKEELGKIDEVAGQRREEAEGGQKEEESKMSIYGVARGEGKWWFCTTCWTPRVSRISSLKDFFLIMKRPYVLVQKLSEQWKIHLFISEDERGIDQHFQPSLYKNY